MEEYEKWILFSDNLDAGDKRECQNAFQATGAKVLFSSKLKRSIGFHDIGAIKEIYRLCKKERFDIVHTHSTKPGIVGRIAATLARVPLVIHTVHGLAFHKFIKFPKWQFYWTCEMFASLFCDKIVMVNKYYSKYFKWFKRKTCTIYNGVDFSLFFHKKKEGSNLLAKLLFVGRLDEQKDPLTLLAAFRLVVNKYPEVMLTMVGDGEKYKQCRDYIDKNNLDSNVKLEGWQNDVAKYYASADIFVAPSIFESFGLMFVEAGYYKLPVVATNVEGIPEVVADGVTGLLSNPQDSQTIATNIIRLIEDNQLRTAMSEAAYDHVTRLFNSEKMTQQYKELYN